MKITQFLFILIIIIIKIEAIPELLVFLFKKPHINRSIRFGRDKATDRHTKPLTNAPLFNRGLGVRIVTCPAAY